MVDIFYFLSKIVIGFLEWLTPSQLHNGSYHNVITANDEQLFQSKNLSVRRSDKHLKTKYSGDYLYLIAFY